MNELLHLFPENEVNIPFRTPLKVNLEQPMQNITLTRQSQAKVQLLLTITALSAFLSGLIIRVCFILSYRSN